MYLSEKNTLFVSLALLLLSYSAPSTWAQAKRKPVEPVDMLYDTQIPGVDASSRECYVQAFDGLYVPAIILKPAGKGPFPVLIYVHGAPGGRSVSGLKEALYKRPAMVEKRFLKEGYVIVRCSYRNRSPEENAESGRDVASVIRFAKKLPEADATKVCLYGNSRGAENILLALGEEDVAAAVLNAPGGMTYLGINRTKHGEKISALVFERALALQDVLPEDLYDREVAYSYLRKVNSPMQFVVGTADKPAILLNNTTVGILKELEKDVALNFYPDEEHMFNLGGRKKDGTSKPSIGAIKALDDAVAFFESKISK